MKINEMKIGLATGLAFAILWVMCSMIVLIFPAQMMQMTANMVHLNASDIQWQMGYAGFCVGLMAWTFTAGVTGWLIAFIYNRLLLD